MSGMPVRPPSLTPPGFVGSKVPPLAPPGFARNVSSNPQPAHFPAPGGPPNRAPEPYSGEGNRGGPPLRPPPHVSGYQGNGPNPYAPRDPYYDRSRDPYNDHPNGPNSAPPFQRSLYPAPPQHGGGGGGYGPPMNRDGPYAPYPRGPHFQPPPNMHNGPPFNPPFRRGGFNDGPWRSRRHESEELMRAPTNTVWVGNLDKANVNMQNLRRTFHEFGKVMLISRAPGKSFCFLHFRRVEEAQRAVETLMHRNTLGPVKFNYAKMYDYTSEEMAEPWDPSEDPEESSYERRTQRELQDKREERIARRRATDYSMQLDDGPEDGPRRKRNREGSAPLHEPTNVLWVGDLPSSVSVADLQEHFQSFGKIENISRPENRSIAFVYFDSIKNCTAALEGTKNTTIGGQRVVVNYGSAPRNPAAAFSHSETTAGITFNPISHEGGRPNYQMTNTVCLRQLDIQDVTVIEKELAKFPGLINCKYLPRDGMAFAHFETPEQADVCLRGLEGVPIEGMLPHICFGKTNHSLTMKNYHRHTPGEQNYADDATSAGYGTSGLDGSSGALVAGASEGAPLIALPKMGMSGTEYNGPLTVSVSSRVRAPPKQTPATRLQSLLSMSYNECGEENALLPPSTIQTLCDTVDDCIDEASAAQLDEFFKAHVPVCAAHVFCILAKRLNQYFNDDPHKKLLVLYSATRALASTIKNGLTFTTGSIDAFLSLVTVVGENQDKEGTEYISTITDYLKRRTTLEALKLPQEYTDSLPAMVDEIAALSSEASDLSSLLTRRRAPKN